jgi:hypothetical protein
MFNPHICKSCIPKYDKNIFIRLLHCIFNKKKREASSKFFLNGTTLKIRTKEYYYICPECKQNFTTRELESKNFSVLDKKLKKYYGKYRYSARNQRKGN